MTTGKDFTNRDELRKSLFGDSLDLQEVHSYLLNQLPEEEMERISKLIKEDQDYRAEFKKAKEMLAGLDFHFEQKLRTRLKLMEKAGARKRTLARLAMAASVVLIVSSSLLTFFYQPPVDHLALFKENYKPYYNIVSGQTRGVEENDQMSDYELGLRKYDLGSYDEAADLLRKRIIDQPDDYTAKFYLAICLLETNQVEVIQQFQDVATTKSEFREPAQWYLILTYIKMGEIDKAVTIIDSVDPSSSYYQRATDLRDRLK